MDHRRRSSDLEIGPASGQSDMSRRADEFSNPMSLENLAARWRCSSKTARARVATHGLGINPAGTWLISRQRVQEFEESLRTRLIATPAEAKTDETQDRVKSELMRLGILRTRWHAPNIVKQASRPFRKVG